MTLPSINGKRIRNLKVWNLNDSNYKIEETNMKRERIIRSTKEKGDLKIYNNWLGIIHLNILSIIIHGRTSSVIAIEPIFRKQQDIADLIDHV